MSSRRVTLVTAADEPGGPAAVPLLEPRGGIPDVVESATALAETVKRFAAGEGPVAVDAERASGYRYSQRAYLVQLRRSGAGTALIDPIACPDLSELSAAIAEAEWVLHAANQDLPCLAGVGMTPKQLFDTELGARIAGYERVGLATMSEIVLGHQLAKEHSAVDWSRRPLPRPWLAYAALDVEILVDLRDALEGELRRQGKLEWVHEEFDAILQAPPAPPVRIRGGGPAASTGSGAGGSSPSYAPCGMRATISLATATWRRDGCCPTAPSWPRPAPSP